MKIVIFNSYGAPYFSKEVYEHMGLMWDYEGAFRGLDMRRDDPKLVAAVEALGSKKSALSTWGSFKVVEIPDDVDNWVIENYDGWEHVTEPHRTWK